MGHRHTPLQSGQSPEKATKTGAVPVNDFSCRETLIPSGHRATIQTIWTLCPGLTSPNGEDPRDFQAAVEVLIHVYETPKPQALKDIEADLIALLRRHYWEAGLSGAFASALARKCVEYGDGVPIVREGPHSTNQTREAVAVATSDPEVQRLQAMLTERRTLAVV